MKNISRFSKFGFALSACLFLLILLNGCDFPFSQSPIDLPEPPEGKISPDEGQVDAVPLQESVVIPDYSKYTAIADKEYYINQYFGEIFIIKEWHISSPQENTLSVYGRIPFTMHPNQSLSALEFNDPNQPVILTGFGEGWGIVVTRGEGHGAVSGQSADISMVCTGEVKAEFKLVGGFYPYPSCALDVDIVTTYFPESSVVTCVYNNGMEIPLPMESFLDMFTDVKLPITFQIPDGYVTRFVDTNNNVAYDLSYYLYNFWGKAPSDEELSLVFGDQPAKFYQTGCQSVHLEFDPSFLPEGSELLENPPSAWDIMLTPESKRGL